MTTQTIAELNDKFRRYENRNLGRYMMTSGVQALALEKQAQLISLVRNFDSFTTGNDHYGERDFGKVVLDGESFYWRIDYYAPDYRYGSEDPSNPEVTRRVMTIMHSSER